jgi:hypothetical protein
MIGRFVLWLDTHLYFGRVALLLLIPNAAQAQGLDAAAAAWGPQVMELLGAAGIAVWFAQKLLAAQEQGLDRIAEATELQASAMQGVGERLAQLEERTRTGDSLTTGTWTKE